MLDKIKKIVYNLKEFVMVVFLLFKSDVERLDIKFHKKIIMNIVNLQDSQEKEKKEWAIELTHMFEKDYLSLHSLVCCFVGIALSPLISSVFVRLLDNIISEVPVKEFLKLVLPALLGFIWILILKLLMDKIKKSNTAFNSQVVATKDVGIGLKSFYNDLEYIDYIYKTIKKIHNNWKK